jgi:hypothetical protein
MTALLIGTLILQLGMAGCLIAAGMALMQWEAWKRRIIKGIKALRDYHRNDPGCEYESALIDVARILDIELDEI